ncbi:hypothetical protein EDC01DRAFT_626096 [Geopyxis carbonaria]|nr:hypothetical protein EDC01DRAFT_626096 [Geopyxis carbonaria]
MSNLESDPQNFLHDFLSFAKTELSKSSGSISPAVISFISTLPNSTHKALHELYGQAQADPRYLASIFATAGVLSVVVFYLSCVGKWFPNGQRTSLAASPCTVVKVVKPILMMEEQDGDIDQHLLQIKSLERYNQQQKRMEVVKDTMNADDKKKKKFKGKKSKKALW